MSLDDLRRGIDRIDAELVACLNERAEQARRIGEEKRRDGIALQHPDREKEVVDHACSLSNGPLRDEDLAQIYRAVIAACTAVQSPAAIGPPQGNAAPLFDKLAILGLGLMGGSLGQAARRAGVARTVCAYARRAETRQLAGERGVADEVSDDPRRAVRGADLVVVCVPVLAVPELTALVRDDLAPGCVVSDVGSTKNDLNNAMIELLAGTGALFVGSHPIAGSEASGLESARPDLYEGARVVVTPGSEGADSRSLDGIVSFWNRLGAATIVMGPADHDAVLARTSHLPHMVAAVLTETVLGDGNVETASFCGSGFADTTRVAAGSEALWHDIFRTNREAVLSELGAFGEILERVTCLLKTEDYDGLRGFLARARQQRRDVLADRERPRA